MKKYLAPWGIALITAVVIHLLVITTLRNTHWFDIEEQSKTQSSFEVSLISPAQDDSKTVFAPLTAIAPATDLETKSTILEDQNANIIEKQGSAIDFSLQQNENDDFINNSSPTTSPPIDITNASTETKNISAQNAVNDMDISQIKKSDLFDLSKISLSPDASDEDLNGVFSPTLQAQIEASKAAQQEYLKGQIKETHYPITEDADGTRYVNIKGVCWRIPKEGSDEGWVIVFAGCNGQTESFHFELNITPGTLLDPDSPFSIGQ